MKYERIRNLREDRDLTQTEIAEILNCSQRIYSNYERGDVDIPTEILIALAHYHNTSIDYLLGSQTSGRPIPGQKTGIFENFPLHSANDGGIMTPTC